jgi:hypothetical protein
MTTSLLTNDAVITTRTDFTTQTDLMRAAYRALATGFAVVAGVAVRVLETPTFADRLHDPDHAAIR